MPPTARLHKIALNTLILCYLAPSDEKTESQKTEEPKPQTFHDDDEVFMKLDPVLKNHLNTLRQRLRQINELIGDDDQDTVHA